MFKRIFNEIKYLVNRWCWSNAINANWNASVESDTDSDFTFASLRWNERVFNGETFSTIFRDTDFHFESKFLASFYQNFQIPTVLDT